MVSTLSFRSIVAVVAILGGACSSNSSPSSGTGGALGTGGVPGQGGTSAAGGQSGIGGTKGSGGAGQGGTLGGGGATQPGTGGASGTGGRTSVASGGAGAGGQPGTGGTTTGAGGSTLAGSGGKGGLGGSTSPGSGGTTGAGTGGATGAGSGGSSGNPGVDGGVAQSAGCGKTRTIQNGTITIQSTRKYILRVPDGYDNTHAYRLVFAFAESGSSAQSVATRNYFTMATYDTKNTIFVAPDAVGSAGSWSKTDVDFTDAILAQLEGDLCIDTTRIFATGFSFGGAMSIALACTRADVFRAVAFFSGADLTGSCPSTLSKPIAYYASQASQDSTGTPSPTSGRTIQAKFAAVNGCTADPNAINFPAAGQPHTCTIYKNCSAGHPTVYCVFDGAHGWEPKDPGQTTSWDAPEAWKFITQF
jgi:poly(3-hydroxybutyrate) depolymerase